MAHGQADFGMYAVKEVFATLSDLGELAARLGSIVIFDRRGDVLYFDNFEDPVLKWAKAGSSGYAVALDTTYPRSGSQCVKLTLPATADSFVRIEKSVQFRGSYRLGIEASFGLVNQPTRPELYVELYTGSRVLYAQLRFDYTNQKLEFVNSDGNWQTLAEDVLVAAAAYYYHTMKLVFDGETEKYVRAMFGYTEYDLSAYSLYGIDSEVAPSVVCQLKTSQETAAAYSVWFDDFILTINEP